ncbi:Ferm, Arhgef And Pleckstrin Domain-Containing Protein 1 [Manis pentadactyla]|nr:Ferm, Arhgef And Pleckstrin Domain-Containing Protein 1 [Manis pentadactyla]
MVKDYSEARMMSMETEKGQSIDHPMTHSKPEVHSALALTSELDGNCNHYPILPIHFPEHLYLTLALDLDRPLMLVIDITHTSP